VVIHAESGTEVHLSICANVVLRTESGTEVHLSIRANVVIHAESGTEVHLSICANVVTEVHLSICANVVLRAESGTEVHLSIRANVVLRAKSGTEVHLSILANVVLRAESGTEVHLWYRRLHSIPGKGKAMTSMAISDVNRSSVSGAVWASARNQSRLPKWRLVGRSLGPWAEALTSVETNRTLNMATRCSPIGPLARQPS